MKQHITVEQLNELSEKGKERLRKWWKPEYGDRCGYHYHTYKGIWKFEEHIYIDQMGYDIVDQPIASAKEPEEHDYPIICIGQMIEFLGYLEISPPSGDDSDEWGPNHDNWEVHLTCNNELYYGFELCDALWEACKEVLSNE